MVNFRNSSLRERERARLTHGAFVTFSKIASSGFSLNNTSVAARNVSPEQPLSSMSMRNFERSIEKFLHEVPATKRLNGGIFCSCP